MKPNFQKLTEFIASKGTRKAGMKLISDSIYIHSGLTISDLPDTSELCCMYDDMEELLNEYMLCENDITRLIVWERVTEMLNEIDYDFVHNLMAE